MGEIPDDAKDLLSEGAIEFWSNSGQRFGDDFPDELADMRPWVDELRARGLTELEIACAFARFVGLAREEHFGLIERVTQPDGTGLIYDRDPFERLPLTDEPEIDLGPRE